MGTQDDNLVNDNLIKNEKFGIDFVFPEILQGELETYEATVGNVMKSLENVQIAALHGAVVRGAWEAGWITKDNVGDNIPEGDVGKAKPAFVQWLSGVIMGKVSESRIVSGE